MGLKVYLITKPSGQKAPDGTEYVLLIDIALSRAGAEAKLEKLENSSDYTIAKHWLTSEVKSLQTSANPQAHPQRAVT